MESSYRSVLVAVLAALWAGAAHAQSFGGSAGVASEYVFRGVSQSDGNPSGQLDLHYYGSRDWYAGVWAASVRRGDERTTAELNAYLGYNFAIVAPWNGSVTLVHYDYPWNHPRSSYAYDELSATLAYSDRLFVSVAASPDTALDRSYGRTTRGAAFAYDLSGRRPLWHGWAADAGIGYYDLHRQLDAGYAYYSAGVDYRWRMLQLQVLYIGTDARAKRLFYEDAAHDWTATALWRF
jgi:uncharacterized protein (TIGR02001 family)